MDALLSTSPRSFPNSSVGKESTYNAGDPSLIPGSGRSAGEGVGYPLQYSLASLAVQLVNNSPAMWETWVWSLSWDDPLEKGKGYPLQYSGLENFMDCIVHGVANSQTRLNDFYFFFSNILGLIWFSTWLSEYISYYFLNYSHFSLSQISPK